MSSVHHPAGKEKRSRKRLRLVTYRLKVFVWRSAEGEDALPGFSFLSELSSSGLGLFLERELAQASSVRIAFEEQSGPTYRAAVVWSDRYAASQQFLGHDALEYRAGLRLQFVSEAERQRYLKYVEELKARVLSIDPRLKF